jgi:hypothetical protein
MRQIPRQMRWNTQPVDSLLAQRSARGVLIAASKDPDAKLTFIVTPPDTYPPGQRLAVKIPATEDAGQAVEREGRMLVALRRMPLGDLASTIPRYVESRSINGRQVLVSTALTGTPMSVGYHRWLHTARPALVRQDFRLAGDWLHHFQTSSEVGRMPMTWGRDVAEVLTGRWDGHPALDGALARLEVAQGHFGGATTPRAAVHGDFWFGNLLVQHGRVSGVVDWETGAPEGSPLRDLARFALAYSLYLDRHTRPGNTVVGHRLRREGFAPGVRYALHGSGWLPRTVRSFLADGLTRLHLPRALWYDVALVGIAEIAASANDDAFGSGHLELLAGLPLHPRRRRGPQ